MVQGKAELLLPDMATTWLFGVGLGKQCVACWVALSSSAWAS